MKIDEFITGLRKNHDIIISVQGNELKVKASKESLTEEIVTEIKQRKSDILHFFKHLNLRKPQTIQPAGTKEYYKLSSVQKRLFFLYKMDKSSLAYNMPQIVCLKGNLDKNKLKEVFEDLIFRHESLRTQFVERDGGPVQKILQDFDFDITHYNSEQGRVDVIIDGFIKPFDLFKGPLIRVGLIGLSSEDNVLMVDMHHIISDGVSRSILIKEFMMLYNCQRLPVMELQYKDFAEWQQSPQQQKEIEKQKGFWIKEFSEEVTPLDLPTDFLRPKIKSYEGSSMEFNISKANSEKLQSIADKERTTIFMVLLSIYNVLLGKLGNQEDVTVGNSSAGRRQTGLEGVFGMFVNTVPLRNYPRSSLTFKEFLSDVTSRTMACFDNEAYQYDDLVGDLKIERDTSRNPLFDARFIFQNFENVELKMPGLKIKTYETGIFESKFDLTLTAMEKEGQIRLLFEYSTKLFKENTIKRFVGYFNKIVSIVTKETNIKISEIDILSDLEKHNLLNVYDGEKTDYPVDKTIIDLFTRQVQRTPGANSVVYQGNSLTYMELDNRSNQLAILIGKLNKDAGIVALFLEPCLDMIVCMFAVLKVGLAFLPLDPQQSSRRQEEILKESGCQVLICQKRNENGLSFTGEKLIIDTLSYKSDVGHINGMTPRLDSIAYVIYTSGSTGEPKGVKISNANLVNYSIWLKNTLMLDRSDKSILTSSYAFDLGYSSIFPTLISGAELHLIPKSLYQSPDSLLEYLDVNQISYLKLTPSLFATLNEASNFRSSNLDKMRYILLGGEPIKVADIEKVKTVYDHIKFINHYGPTETTIGAIAQKIGDFNNYKLDQTIGKPISNNKALILDKNLKLVPTGTKGELCIGGSGVGVGYLNDESLTNDKFISTEYCTEIVYRTGDFAKWLPDGNIKFMGRNDHQIKIRGFRIEPREIENHLSSHDQIMKAVVVTKGPQEDKYLVAYYIAHKEIDKTELNNFLSDLIPDYMVPLYYIRLDALPLTPNGKLDEKALPAPVMTTQGDRVAPLNDIEKALINVWSAVLSVETIGTTENFFALGGDSIKSIQITARMRKLGYKMAVNDIFAYQTIQDLSKWVTPIETLSVQKHIQGDVGLTPIQKRFFNSNLVHQNHYNQSIMLKFEQGISHHETITIFKKIQEHHDALRMVFRKKGNKVIQQNKGLDQDISLVEHDLRLVEDQKPKLDFITNQIQSGIDLVNGPLMRLGLFHMDNGSHLLIVIHHLVVDGVSWRILLEDIDSLYQNVKMDQDLAIQPKTDSYLSWSDSLAAYTRSDRFKEISDFWDGITQDNIEKLLRDNAEGTNMVKDVQNESLRLSKGETGKLLGEVHVKFGTQIIDILLTALLLSIKKQYDIDGLLIYLEGHGREDIQQGVNVSRTVGWFTSIYPIVLRAHRGGLPSTIKQVKETLRTVPNRGFDFLLHQSLGTSDEAIDKIEHSNQIKFNYLGQFDVDSVGNSFVISEEAKGNETSVEEHRHFDWDMTGIVVDKQLEMRLAYSKHQYQGDKMQQLMRSYKKMLVELIDYCCSYGKIELSPSDLTYKSIAAEHLDQLQIQFDIEDIYPLSPLQEGMLFHSLLDGDSQHYFEQKTLGINGKLDPVAMEKSMNDLIARYQVLRTVFLYEGLERPLQVVLKERKMDFRFKDVRKQCRESSREEVIQFYKSLDRSHKFDLSKDMLMRVSVLQTGHDEFKIIWSHHHILMDGWCVSIIWRDLEMFYLKNTIGNDFSLPAVRPYANYIQWLENRNKEESAKYWENYLKGYDNLATLPKKALASLEGFSINYGVKELFIKEEVTQNLNKLSVQYGVTLNTIIQCVWGVLLAKYNNTNDVIFGAVVSGRSAEIEGVEDMVGLFINTVPVRIKYDDGSSFGQLLQKAQKSALESERHHYNPLSEIQALSEPGRELLDHIMAFENYPIADQIQGAQDQIDGLNVSGIEIVEQPNYDLWIIVMPGDQIKIKFGYNANVYNSEIIERVSTHFSNIIGQVATCGNVLVNGIDLVTPEEKKKILFEFNDTRQEYSFKKLIHQLFEERVEVCRGHTAVVAGGVDYSYEWLNTTSNQLSAYLKEKGVTRETPVAIIMERKIELIVVLFAILKSGGKYIPIEPYLPENRKKSILNSVGAEVILTNWEHCSMVSSFEPDVDSINHVVAIDNEGTYALDVKEVVDERKQRIYLSDYTSSNPEPVNSSEDLAYVIFTSGSSGEPKGVAVQHKPVINLIEWVNNTYNLGQGDKILLVSSISFDLSVYDIFGGLAAGACVRLANKEELEDPDLLAEIIVEEGITFWDSAPAMLQQVVPFLQNRKEAIKLKGKLRLSFSSGDWIPLTMPDQMKGLFDCYQFIALGGATEATVWSNYYEVNELNPRWRSIPYGKPIQNARYLILDRNRNLCPVGVPGDLYIGGQCLAIGYTNDKELSDSKFMPSPFYKGEMLYATGDTAQWFPDGNIEFLGRKDSQVKIRGYRIELGEIENRLLKFKGIDRVLAHVIARSRYDKFICLYYIAEKEYEVKFLKEFLSNHLPDYMVPQHIMRLKVIPTTKNGKVDRKKLPQPQLASPEPAQPPQTETQRKVVEVWAHLLHLKESDINLDSDFFELGGHSILAVHLISLIQKGFSVELKLREVFENANVKKMSDLIDRSSENKLVEIPRVKQRGFYVASPAQTRLYYEQLLNKDMLAYNICGAFVLGEDIVIEKFKRSIQLLVDRHEGLRTSFLLSDQGVMQKINSDVRLEIPILRKDGLKSVEAIFEEFVRPFDLFVPPLMRCAILKEDNGLNIFMIDIHHIISDGISLGILMRDLNTIYYEKGLSPLELRYVDFANWQADVKGKLEKQRRFWHKKLSGDLPFLDLPVTRSREGVDIYPASTKMLMIEGNLYQELKGFTTAENVSDFMFLLSIYYILLSKISGSSDIIVGTDAVGRTHPKLRNIVGTFINLLPLRIQIFDNQTYYEFLRETRECVLDAFDNQDFQFDQMVAFLNEGQKKTERFVQVHFAFANFLDNVIEEGDLRLNPYPIEKNRTTQYEFKLEATEKGDNICVEFIYSKALYEDETMDILIEYYKKILTSVLKDNFIRIDKIEMEGSLSNA